VAHHTLPQLFHPGFQQVLDGALGQQIRRIERVLSLAELHCCEFEDEFGCGAVATVSDLESEREYCPRHFRNVSMKAALRELEVSRG